MGKGQVGLVAALLGLLVGLVWGPGMVLLVLLVLLLSMRLGLLVGLEVGGAARVAECGAATDSPGRWVADGGHGRLGSAALAIWCSTMLRGHSLVGAWAGAACRVRGPSPLGTGRLVAQFNACCQEERFV